MKSNKIASALDGQVAAVRSFSRFYTRKLGILEPKLLHSPFTLQEARIIYEIAHGPVCTATDLTRSLSLDPGFLSRTLQALQRRQIVSRKPSTADGRVNELSLTAKGRAASTELERRSQEDVGSLLASLDDNQRAAMGHQLRGTGRRDLRAVHQNVRRLARALLDCGGRRRADRLGLPGEGR